MVIPKLHFSWRSVLSSPPPSHDNLVLITCGYYLRKAPLASRIFWLGLLDAVTSEKRSLLTFNQCALSVRSRPALLWARVTFSLITYSPCGRFFKTWSLLQKMVSIALLMNVKFISRSHYRIVRIATLLNMFKSMKQTYYRNNTNKLIHK